MRFGVRFCVNDVGGSLGNGGIFDTLEEALERASKLRTDSRVLCDPWEPWVVELNDDGSERVVVVDGKKRLVVHEIKELKWTGA